MNWKNLNCCATSRLGNILQYEVGAATYALVPRMTYVPWIVLNGQHTNDVQRKAERNLLGFICDNYKVNLIVLKRCQYSCVSNYSDVRKIRFFSSFEHDKIVIIIFFSFNIVLFFPLVTSNNKNIISFVVLYNNNNNIACF